MPLIRITVGPVKQQGINILRWSIPKLKEIYPECDLCICHNQWTDTSILERLGIELVRQEDYLDSLPYPPPEHSVAWKLFPPRLRPDDYEIVVDNDILFFRRISEIDTFLKSDMVLLYQGLNDNRGGQYQDQIPTGIRVNSGIFGMPPKFEPKFEEKIKPWKGYYDEQGLVAASLLRNDPYLMVPLTAVPLIQPGWDIQCFLRSEQLCGLHFCGINKGHHVQFAWFEKCLECNKNMV
jgi:hypothetical protein